MMVANYYDVMLQNLWDIGPPWLLAIHSHLPNEPVTNPAISAEPTCGDHLAVAI